MYSRIFFFSVFFLFFFSSFVLGATSFSVTMSPINIVPVGTLLTPTIQARTETGAIDTTYNRTVILEIQENLDPNMYTVPSNGLYTFSSGDNGSKTFSSGLIINKTGIYTFVVFDITDQTISGQTTLDIISGSSYTFFEPTQNQIYTTGDIAIRGQSIYAYGILEYWIDGLKKQEGTMDGSGYFTALFTGLTEGIHTAQVKFYTVQKTALFNSAVVPFLVDTKPPSIQSITGQRVGGSASTSYTISLLSNEPVVCKRANTALPYDAMTQSIPTVGASYNTGYSFSYTGTPGENKIFVQCKDMAGHKTIEPVLLSLVAPLPLPIINNVQKTILASGQDIYFSRSFTASGVMVEKYEVQVAQNRQFTGGFLLKETTLGTNVHTVFTETGDYYWKVIVFDTKGGFRESAIGQFYVGTFFGGVIPSKFTVSFPSGDLYLHDHIPVTITTVSYTSDLVPSYRGQIRMHISGQNIAASYTLPHEGSYIFTGRDGGKKTFWQGLQIFSPGTYTFFVYDTDHPLLSGFGEVVVKAPSRMRFQCIGDVPTDTDVLSNPAIFPFMSGESTAVYVSTGTIFVNNSNKEQAASLSSGDRVQIRLRSAATPDTTTMAILQMGTGFQVFAVTTKQVETATEDVFSLTTPILGSKQKVAIYQALDRLLLQKQQSGYDVAILKKSLISSLQFTSRIAEQKISCMTYPRLVNKEKLRKQIIDELITALQKYTKVGKTYTNTGYELSFQYPGYWQIALEENRVKIKSGDNLIVTIKIIPTENATTKIQEIIAAEKQNIGKKEGTTEYVLTDVIVTQKTIGVYQAIHMGKVLKKGTQISIIQNYFLPTSKGRLYQIAYTSNDYLAYQQQVTMIKDSFKIQ